MTHQGSDAVRDGVLALARRRGWTTIDPLAEFRSAQASMKVFLDQWHPTPAGHRIIAEQMVRALSCAGELGEHSAALCVSSGR
jgi:hypothetical protein